MENSKLVGVLQLWFWYLSSFIDFALFFVLFFALFFPSVLLSISCQNSSSFLEVNRLEETKNPHKNFSFLYNFDENFRILKRILIPWNELKLQSNLSRKGSQRGGDMMIATSSAPMAEKSATAAAAEVALVVGSAKDHLGVQQFHHQITITTGTTAAPDEHALFRRNSFRRSSSSWFLDPKKVLLFFATV